MPIPADPDRHDPYRAFNFKVMWGGAYVAGIDRVSGLRRTTEVIELREAGSPLAVTKLPGMVKYDAIVLQRGITADRAFEDWANEASAAGDAAFRKDLRIEVYDEAGRLFIAYNVRNAWVSEFTALPALEANAGAVAMEALVLQHDGWERDLAVAFPPEAPEAGLAEVHRDPFRRGGFRPPSAPAAGRRARRCGYRPRAPAGGW